MLVYIIEHRLRSLIEILGMDGEFCIEGITFSRWDHYLEGGVDNYFWLARGQEKGRDFLVARNIFRKKLSRIVPRLSLIGQAYIEFTSEPYLISKEHSQHAFFQHVIDTEPVPLNIMDSDVTALKTLLNNPNIPDEFYYYWNDAVNSIEYSSKLLLLCAALDSMAGVGLPQKRDRTDKREFYKKIEEIIGPELKESLWGTSKDPHLGLRQRLVHGEYLGPSDAEKDYVELVHHKIIKYFNDVIFNEELLAKDIVGPQRHFSGNKKIWQGLIETAMTSNLNLKSVLQDFDENSIDNLPNFKIVIDPNLIKKF